MNSVECAYPVAEDLAVGLLYVGANTFAIPTTFIGQILLAAPDSLAFPFYPYLLWSVGAMVLGLVPVLLFNGQYLRLDEDTKLPPDVLIVS